MQLVNPSSLLLGTRNPARIAVTRLALAELPLRLVTLEEARVTAEAEEEGQTSAENAVIKALFYCHCSGLPTLAMDGALWIDKFPPEKQPGVLVRRVNGRPRTDLELLTYYKDALAEVGGNSRATWSGGQALALPGEEVIFESYSFEVIITSEPLGEPQPGHPLDPLMRRVEDGSPYTALTAAEMPYFSRIRAFIASHLPRLLKA